MRRSIGSATSPAAPRTGGSNDTSSPPVSRWLFPRAMPSTSTSPPPTSRSAAARDPTEGSPARKRSSRSPAAASGTRRRCVGHALPAPRLAVGEDQREEQDPDPDHDEAVREVEGRPKAQVEEVRDVPEPDAVDEVRDASADDERGPLDRARGERPLGHGDRGEPVGGGADADVDPARRGLAQARSPLRRQSMHCVAYGIASSRSSEIGCPQLSQIPKVPSAIRSSAPSIALSTCSEFSSSE